MFAQCQSLLARPPVDFQEALIAIASVSVVVWTGGLIIFQLLSGDERRRERRTTSAAMALAAFSALAPLFGLLFSECGMRYTGLLLGAIYLALTWSTVPELFAWRTQPGPEGKLDSIAAFGFVMPTIAMFVVAVWPSTTTIAIASVILLFLSYFVMSEHTRR